VRLRTDFEDDFFADMLSDFFDEHVMAANFHTIDGGYESRGHELTSDPKYQPVLNLMARIFKDADDDHSGTLTTREFRHVMAKPHVRHELKGLGIQIEDFDVLFRNIDSDHSGEVTLDELCDGFVKMKSAMRGVNRIVAYFRKVFAEKDVDSSGSLNLDEFKMLCEDAGVQKKMLACGIDLNEIDGLYEEIVAESGKDEQVPCGEVTLDRMIAAFLRMRDPSLGIQRGKSFLRQIFQSADKDGTGRISRADVREAFCNNDVSTKLTKFGLTVPDWINVFDEIDYDGDGELSWWELSQGVVTIWEEELQDKLANDDSRKRLLGSQLGGVGARLYVNSFL